MELPLLHWPLWKETHSEGANNHKFCPCHQMSILELKNKGGLSGFQSNLVPFLDPFVDHAESWRGERRLFSSCHLFAPFLKSCLKLQLFFT